MQGNLKFAWVLVCTLVGGQPGCSSVEERGPLLLSAAAPVPAPTAISDRGVQEHSKAWPMSIDSAYMGTGGENRNSGSVLVTSYEQRKLAGQSEYLSWTQPNSPPVSALMTNGSTEASNGLVIAASPRGGGTSTVVALDLNGKVVWRTEEWTGADQDGDGTPDQAGQRNAVASSAGLQAPMVDREGGVYVSDNYGIWKLDQDTGARIWFSRFLDYSANMLGSNDLRLVNEGGDGLVGTVFASGWHIWVDRRDGHPVIVQEPEPFSAHDCPQIARLYITISGGELDKSGELDDIACLAANANNTVPQPNNVAVRPAIPGVSKHTRYLFTYAGQVGDPENSRLIAYDFTYSPVKGEGWGVKKAWERVIHGGTSASPTLTPDLQVVNASDDSGALNLTEVDSGAPLRDPPVSFNNNAAPGNTIDGWYCDSGSSACVAVDGSGVTRVDPTAAGEIAAQALPQRMNDYPIPFLWGTIPFANYSGGAVLDPARWNVTANIGYPYHLGPLLGTTTGMGDITPNAMVPVTFDADTGKLLPGQSFAPELTRPGTAEASAMVTSTGRYVVQKAELLTLFYYYLFQGNYNYFNTNNVSYDDVSPPELAQLQALSETFHRLGPGPIDAQGVVPEQWQVPQPEAGLTIYEPVSFATAARNQVEMDLGFVKFAASNLCLTEGCALEEAAARLGYAAWNIDKAFQRQLAEAIKREQIHGEYGQNIAADATAAAADCRRARKQLLAKQPALPSESALAEARTLTANCMIGLTTVLEAL